MDAFVVAFRIPNLFRDMLAEGSLGSAFTKVYSQTKTYEEQRARELLRGVSHLPKPDGILDCSSFCRLDDFASGTC